VSDAGYELVGELPSLNDPILVGMLTGWIDASGAAAAAVTAIESASVARTMAIFDSDTFIDYRARRPTMELRDGVNTRLSWSDIELKVGRDPAGRDLLILTGAEPDSAWKRFATAATDLCVQLGVSTAVFLGAYPFAAPHSRAPRLSSSSPNAALLAKVPFLKNSVDVPAGMGAVLEHSLHARGVDALGIWAQVPSYLGGMSYPAASIALIDGLAQLTDLKIDTTALRGEAAIQRQRIDQLVAGNDEHESMVHRLEQLYDNTEQQVLQLGDTPIPTGDELAAEFERFLRDQQD
jgi:proteasome assembly chaperone (PAC2) family protein